ncbi:Inner membrane protein YbhI [Legionella cherrii]|uniref:Inner membrane protein YbhI n=1 Tax=Legionella cherrii TaxID=28084 RepID=A0A0W0SA37_9GAMM|nr:SLC13 family permease [Legionella cherrii]KTC79979.1 Inner membrane protein YbhI [Legionella cherrii]
MIFKYSRITPEIGFSISGVLCAFISFYLNQNTGIDLSHTSFIVILGAAFIMWTFRLVPEYIPALLIIFSALLFHIAPKNVILSGFTSNSFFIAVSVFGVGAIVTKSRLFYRFALILLIHLPSKSSLLQKLLFFIGALITPIMSVQSSRVALIAPLLDNILESSTIHPRSDTANALANAAFNGCILLSTIFLTGKSSNFIVFSLLSEQNQWQGNWMHWLWAASFPGILLIALFFILHSITFKSHNTLKINHFKLKKELYFLGQLSFAEYIAIISLLLFVAGTLISTCKDIPMFWTCLFIFTLLLWTNILEKKELIKKINWSFLFYFGAIIGVMHALQSIGFEPWLIDHLKWLSQLAHANPFWFIIIIYVISWFGGLLLGTMIAPALLFTVIIPLANQGTVSNWVVGFVILMATEAWIFPYQSSYFLCFEELLKSKNNFYLNPLLKLNAWFSLLKLGVIALSIPFWYFFEI